MAVSDFSAESVERPVLHEVREQDSYFLDLEDLIPPVFSIILPSFVDKVDVVLSVRDSHVSWLQVLQRPQGVLWIGESAQKEDELL